MTPAFRNVLLLIVAALVMVVMALMPLQAAHLDGHYLPSHADAFYHGRRILDVVMTGQPVAQFDDHIHVPEGSWITWPWAFDSAMAGITRLFGPFGSETEAMRVLAHVPVAMGVVFAVVVWLVALQLEWSFALRALLVLGATALPVLNGGFAVGNLDHHFAESLWTALTLCAGLWFARKPDGVLPAACLGLVLATANGVHNSLFILQVPVVLYFALRWLQGEAPAGRRSSLVFAASLVLGTLLIALPSSPLQQGFFEFYTLSWFQVYLAGCTALLCVLLAWLRLSAKSVIVLGAASLLMLAPLAGLLGLAGSFVTGNLDSIRGVMEVASPYELYARYGEVLTTRRYSWLLWLSAPALLFNVFVLWRVREATSQFLAAMGVLGLTMLQLQFRFHVFGDLLLVGTPLLAFHLAQRRWPALSGRIAATAVVGMLVAYVPTAGSWSLMRFPASNSSYKELAGMFPVLHEDCAARPGIVLAPLDAGHWIRYHSDCSVIGNVFLLTRQHAEKAFQTERYMLLSPGQLLQARLPVRYVLAFHQVALDPRRPEPDLRARLRTTMPLQAALLRDVTRLPPQYRLRWERITPAGQVYARLYEIVR